MTVALCQIIIPGCLLAKDKQKREAGLDLINIPLLGGHRFVTHRDGCVIVSMWGSFN